ncbi:MAG: phenylalanine--tRNA ligase subunit alpha, partial [Lachnospiraceae bacterium]|nr:phenylalanine--tRNA ligase subunit alpha [Lachnospiraceae bacterium]
MKERIEQLGSQFNEALAKVADPEALEELRLQFMSKKGYVSELMKELGKVSVEQKKEVGQMINSFKQQITDQFDKKKEELVRLQEEVLIQSAESYDESLPTSDPCGSYHPITLVQRELEDIFESMGFDIEDYSEVVTDFECFEAVNIPPFHPARDMQDTY